MQFSLSDFKRNHVVTSAHTRGVRAMCVLTSYNSQSHSRPKLDDLSAGDYLVTASRDGQMRFWDIHSSSKMRMADTVSLILAASD